MSNGTGSGNGTLQKIKDNIKHPGRKSITWFVFSLVGGFSSWMVLLPNWSVALEPIKLGGLLGILASLGLAWSSETFISNKK